MSEPIKAGDLVMVVRGHACVLAVIGGIPFAAPAILQSEHCGLWKCRRCAARDIPGGKPYVSMPIQDAKTVDIPVSWLLKIHPPALDETTDTPEEITA
jgi:hypothetical protein